MYPGPIRSSDKKVKVPCIVMEILFVILTREGEELASMTNSDRPKSNSDVRVMLVTEGSKVMVPPVEFNWITQSRKEFTPWVFRISNNAWYFSVATRSLP